MPQVPPIPPNPGDVIVTGQRRPAGSPGPFPERPVPIVPQGEFDEKEPLGELPDPCANPETALPWNADAAAAAAIAAFRQAAAGLGGADAPNGSPTLTNREFGRAFGIAANGSIYGNAVHWGDPPDPAKPEEAVHMTMNFAGVPPSEYVGFGHTHIDGNGHLSEKDWGTFTDSNNFVRSETGRSDQTFYLYITAVGQNGQADRIYVYSDGPRSAGSPVPPRPTSLGLEVNPDAQPCP